MSIPKNAQIPYELFTSLLDVLEYIDISNYAEDYQSAFTNVLSALQDKKKRMELRNDYSCLVAANKSGNKDKQFEAGIEYLKNKNNQF